MFPIRLAGIHFLNNPILFWPIYKIAMKLFPNKLQDRVRVHSDVESLAKSITPEILPKSLGGSLDEDEAWDDKIMQQIIQNNLCYDCKSNIIYVYFILSQRQINFSSDAYNESGSP